MATEIEERVLEIEQGKVTNGILVFNSTGSREGRSWFDSRTGRTLASREDMQLPIGFKWTTDWKVSRGTDSSTADAEGWVQDGNVRKRLWVRRREKMSSAATTSAAMSAQRPVSASTSSSSSSNH